MEKDKIKAINVELEIQIRKLETINFKLHEQKSVLQERIDNAYHLKEDLKQSKIMLNSKDKPEGYKEPDYEQMTQKVRAFSDHMSENGYL